MARLVGKSDGFTIVEVAVTLVVISIFFDCYFEYAVTS